MNRPSAIACAFALLSTGCQTAPQNTSPADYAAEELPGEEGYRLVLEGLVLQEGLRVIGEEWDDVWIRGCSIRGTRDDGIFVRDVENLRISACEISDVEGQAGIRLSSTGGSEDVLLDHNHIHDVAENGINASQRFDDDVHHRRLRIVGNTIERSGQQGGGGLTHGIYVQSQGHVISGNIVREAGDGNGISVRSSGVVSQNQVYGYTQSGIRYFSDHHAGGGDLRIENNLVVGNGSGAAIEALFSTTTGEAYRVAEIDVRFNTALSENSPAMAFDTRLAPSTRWLVGGNLLFGPTLVHGFAQGANVEADLGDFVSLDAPLDAHLASPHPARGEVDGVAAPALDIDGEARPTDGRDPGADQVY